MNTVKVPYVIANNLHAHVEETDALSASPIACAVADWWARNCVHLVDETDRIDSEGYKMLTTIELATRESPLRKVRP